MKAHIFLGPSLPRGVATTLLDATYAPPVQQGDVLRLVDGGVDVIGIVDGYFETVPAVWHKEILVAMEAGIRVFGAASMGALRAAELQAFGMVGIGQVFAWYRDGVIERDDEVAVQHAPAELGYAPLSTALVDIRDACSAAVGDGAVRAPLAQALVAAASRIAFAERSCESVARSIDPADRDPEVRRWLQFCRTRGPGLKARDAMALLREVAATLERPRERCTVRYRTERTTFLDELRREVGLDRLAAAPAPTRPTRPDPVADGRRAVLLRLLAREAAARNGWELGRDEVSREADRFCVRLGLPDAAAWADWLEARTVSEDAFWRFVNDSLFVEKLARLLESQVDDELIDHLRIAGTAADGPPRGPRSP